MLLIPPDIGHCYSKKETVAIYVYTYFWEPRVGYCFLRTLEKKNDIMSQILMLIYVIEDTTCNKIGQRRSFEILC